jgi:uncharacterized membrane protein
MWPFDVWHLNMVGPLRQAPGGFTHLLVAVDKFSKWIKARPIANVLSEEAVSFFTDIIYHFGIPNTIITDNDTQFTGKNSSISATTTTSKWIGRLLPT